MTRARRTAALFASAFAAALLLAAPAPAQDAPASAGEAIQFDRPIAKGSSFDCEINAASAKTITLSVPGVERPLSRNDSVSVMISGRMDVLATTPAGTPSRIRFTTKNANGSIDGARVDLSELKGKPLLAELKSPRCEFRFESPLDGELSRNSLRALSSVFHPASDGGLAEVMGTDASLSIGSSWRPPLTLLLEQLAKRGIKLSEKDFDALAVLKGRESFRGVDCWRIEERIDTRNTPGIELRLDFSILLPCSPADGGARRIVRSGREFVKKSLPDKNPMSAGHEVQAEVRDSMNATIVPVAGKN